MTTTPLVTTLHGRLDLPDLPAALMSFPKCSFISISDSQRHPLALLRWLRTVHHGIPVEDFEFHPRPGKYLAFLGRISPEKRPDWAIEIAQRAGIPLKIAAKIEGAHDREYFERRVAPGIDGRFIEFVGEISESEKSEFLGNALGLVFPVDWPEPFGLVMVEALACGTPVLARPCGAAAEVLQDGVTGFVDLDIETLARRARELPGISRHGCREWVKKRFSLKRMTEDYIDVYRRAAGHRRDLLHPLERSPHRNPQTHVQR